MGAATFRWKLLTAFGLVYLIWGSTYLGIRFAVETMPPFLMTAARWLLAGAVVLPFALRAGERPALVHWRSAAVIGGLMLLGGNGGVTWAQDRGLHSGMAALLVAMVPLWMALIDWLRPHGVRPTSQVALGLVLGFGGVALLVRPWEGGGDVPLIGALALVVATSSWALGSIYSRHAPLPKTPLLSVGMEMLAGGVLLAVAGLFTGEADEVNAAAFSTKSWLAFAYLTVLGSVVAFIAYIWLLRVSTPAKVSTYAYVNPVVAVFLGAALANEPFTTQTAIAAAVILTGVALITAYRAKAVAKVEAPTAVPTPDTAK